MNELEIFKKVSAAGTKEELTEIITSIADSNDGRINGLSRDFDAKKMASYVDLVFEGTLPVNVITRNFGLRQQLMMIMFYEGKLQRV
jgi:hypothetical protein